MNGAELLRCRTSPPGRQARQLQLHAERLAGAREPGRRRRSTPGVEPSRCGSGPSVSTGSAAAAAAVCPYVSKTLGIRCTVPLGPHHDGFCRLHACPDCRRPKRAEAQRCRRCRAAAAEPRPAPGSRPAERTADVDAGDPSAAEYVPFTPPPHWPAESGGLYRVVARRSPGLQLAPLGQAFARPAIAAGAAAPGQRRAEAAADWLRGELVEDGAGAGAEPPASSVNKVNTVNTYAEFWQIADGTSPPLSPRQSSDKLRKPPPSRRIRIKGSRPSSPAAASPRVSLAADTCASASWLRTEITPADLARTSTEDRLLLLHLVRAGRITVGQAVEHVTMSTCTCTADLLKLATAPAAPDHHESGDTAHYVDVRAPSPCEAIG